MCPRNRGRLISAILLLVENRLHQLGRVLRGEENPGHLLTPHNATTQEEADKDDVVLRAWDWSGMSRPSPSKKKETEQPRPAAGTEPIGPLGKNPPAEPNKQGEQAPPTERLAALLAANRHLRGTRVLYRDDDEPMARATVSRWMKKAQTRAGLPVTGALHILRHTFCSRLAMRGAPAKAIQELAGHGSLATTQRYMHLTPAAKDAAISLLDMAGALLSGDMLETGSATQGKAGG